MKPLDECKYARNESLVHIREVVAGLSDRLEGYRTDHSLGKNVDLAVLHLSIEFLNVAHQLQSWSER